MMSEILLSICIPTYNRAEYLKKSIESIVYQEEFKNKQVEIVIADNASTDDTENIVRQYASQFDNLFYYRNDKNIHNDNFPFVLSKGNGKLRRLCNDTLCFENGALKYMCRIIKKYELTKPFLCWLGENNENNEEVNFRNGMRTASYRITSIACFSIWDSECANIESDTFGAELLLWQVRKMLELASRKDEMVLINKKLTCTQMVYKKNIDYGLYHVFYENYFKLLDPYFEIGKLSFDDKDYLEKDLLLNFFVNWCAQWKLQNTKLQYSKTEDLCACIYQQFHKKSYWKKYKKKFNRLYIKLKIKGIFKKLLARG